MKHISFESRSQSDAICPNCCATGLSSFYRLEGAPVHSCLLMPTRQEALAFPTGILDLAFCPACGFITNTQFEPAAHNYSVRYESTQGFSPCFNSFARFLAQHVVDKYQLKGKTVLEVGCGNGEFIALMCELGPMNGIGVDPAFRPDRGPAGMEDRLRFIQDFYGEKYTHLSCDVLCCRHTLEHIGPTRDFMAMVRRTIREGEAPLIFFEVPDVLRVLREGAFWDLYYEHCTYFTPGSLARLFRATRFRIDELYLDYDDQYIILNAYPSDQVTPPSLALEDDMSVLTEAVTQFSQVCGRGLREWSDRIRDAAAQGEQVVLWGSGSKAVAFLTTLGLREQIEYVVDINPHKHGKYMPGTGQEIVGPEFLRDYQPQWVIAMNAIYRDEIQRDLDRLDVSAKLLCV
jgi:SAM-dependent methyltransferase